ncbi:MAG: UvrD-helicase domain-containing protein, partial [Treponema sp.]|nr:UvrD-helicase domain-containing protein [Treponema sp.]
MAQELSKSYEYLDLLSKKLDDRQKKVCCRTGNTVVAAGAGSGKTQVLATRFAWLVMSCNVPASKILTLTFTKKAAGEMYDRIYQTLSFFAQNPQTPPHEKERAVKALEVFGETHIQTLDSYCSNIVRQAANRYGIRPDFSAGSSDTERQIKDDALPFIIKHRNNPAVLAFANAGRLQDFAENVFAGTVNEYASIADSDTFFTDKLALQCQKVAKDFNYFVFGRGSAPKELQNVQNLTELENQILYEFNEAGIKNEFTEKVHQLLGIIDSIQNNFEEITDEYIANSENPGMQKLLNLCDELAPVHKLNLREKGASKVSGQIKQMRETVKYISSLCAYIRQIQTIKELYLLLNEFHVRVKKSKKISGNLSFRDIQKMALVILQEQPDLRAQENAAYDKIMIDEFQDNNGENRELLFLLCSGAETGSHPTANQIASEKLFFVGDEKQSIYKFRGADVSVFNELQNDFKTNFGPESVLPMEYNYRSENSLITSFNKLFGGENGIFNKKLAATYEAQYTTETKKYNPVQKQVLDPENLTSENVNMHFCVLNKSLFTENDKLPVNEKLDLPDEKEQVAYFIASKINDLCKKDENCENGVTDGSENNEISKKHIPFSKIAILDKSRSNRNYLIKWLNIFGIPYSLDQNASLFSSGLIYDIYNFLRVCVYPSDKKSYAAYLCSPFAGLSWNSVETVLAGGEPDEFALYTQAHDFLEKTRPLVLSQPLTKTLEILWNATG